MTSLLFNTIGSYFIVLSFGVAIGLGLALGLSLADYIRDIITRFNDEIRQ